MSVIPRKYVLPRMLLIYILPQYIYMHINAESNVATNTYMQALHYTRVKTSKYKSIYVCVVHEYYGIMGKLAALFAIAHHPLPENTETVPGHTTRSIILLKSVLTKIAWQIFHTLPWKPRGPLKQWQMWQKRWFGRSICTLNVVDMTLKSL